MADKDDMTTPAGLRLLQESEHSRLVELLKEAQAVQDYMRDEQTKMGVVVEGLAVDSKATATGIIRLVTLQEARSVREEAEESRAHARADKPWAWLADNWKLALGGGIVLVALLAGNPEVIGLVGRYLGVPSATP